MVILRFLMTKAGLLVVVALLMAGASIAYAMVRSTTELPGSFVAVEATYGLSILGKDGEPLQALKFGEVVQGERDYESFAARNDGNVRVKLGFRVKVGDGEDNIFVATERCRLHDSVGPSPLQRGLGKL